MAVIRVRERPRETNAVQFKGMAVNGSEIAAFVSAFQDSGDPLWKPGNRDAYNPDDATVEATVQNILDQWDYPIRPGDWIVVGTQNELLVITDAQYRRQWEPVPLVGVTLG